MKETPASPGLKFSLQRGKIHGRRDHFPGKMEWGKSGVKKISVEFFGPRGQSF
jgi:hypothetical protein